MVPRTLGSMMSRFIQVFTHGINKFLNVGSLKAGGEFFRVQRP